MVTLKGVTAALGSARVLDAVSATIEGGLIGLIGPNGAGKSTLIRAIAGLQPFAGNILIGSRPLAGLPPADRARAIAYLPQGQTVHWPVSVERLVSLGRLPHLAPFARPAPPDRDAIERALERTGTAGFRHRAVDTLSGGERARVLIARALAVEASLLLADEPLAALDPAHQLEVMALLRAEAARGATVVAVLHDLTLAARTCDRLLLLHRGRLVADGSPRDVLTLARLADVYGVAAELIETDGGMLVVPLTISRAARTSPIATGSPATG